MKVKRPPFRRDCPASATPRQGLECVFPPLMIALLSAFATLDSVATKSYGLSSNAHEES